MLLAKPAFTTLPFPEVGQSLANITPDRSCTKPNQLGRLFNEITSY